MNIKNSDPVSESEFDVRLDSYSKRHIQTLNIVQHIFENVNNYSEEDRDKLLKLRMELNDCGNWLLFKNYVKKKKKIMVAGGSCKRFQVCPFCAAMRSYRIQKKYAHVFKSLEDYEAWFLTLTVKNSFDLKSAFDLLKNSWSRMIQHRRKSLSDSSRHEIIEFSKLAGGLMAYEITYSEKYGWHPHIHVFALMQDGQKIDFPYEATEKTYFDRDHWAKLKKWSNFSLDWQRFAGCDNFIVDARPVNDVSWALAEVLRYTTKFSSMSMDRLLESFLFLSDKRRRLVNTFGILREIDLGAIESSLMSDDFAGEELAVDEVFRWLLMEFSSDCPGYIETTRNEIVKDYYDGEIVPPPFAVRDFLADKGLSSSKNVDGQMYMPDDLGNFLAETGLRGSEIGQFTDADMPF